ncbi:SDR family NAD(P)-dependent oxidoreductase [Oscillibacter sp.]|uniref:SDR family NAD(P)-dependent oxidoreductase n=1 Tax=Oscillibacter sp. TaxID=1945593 RepID=UPI002629403D|nr:SDR family NAD(P)-dependent oxidoreductase [Oscillibacter sp.]MDD3346183.1 SDR family NAD(P)-dependent oxidoreductase [Oscillibacter sp.]
MRLENKVSIITGASRGIGFSVARAFLAEGAKLALCGSRQESAEGAAAQLRAEFPDREILPIGADVSDTEAVGRMVETVLHRWGRIDVLVNNAGVTAAKSIFEMEDEDFDSVIRINLVGPFRCIRAVAGVMKAQGGGSIVNTSSMVGTYGGRMQTAYSASKFGINGLTKSCAKELGAYGIRVNAVAPGVVATDMMKASVNEQMLEGLNRATPLGRGAEPSELAGAYVYLASDEASFTTGAILPVDGGIVL